MAFADLQKARDYEPCHYNLYLVSFKFKGVNVFKEEVSFSTGSIDLKSLMSLFLTSMVA